MVDFIKEINVLSTLNLFPSSLKSVADLTAFNQTSDSSLISVVAVVGLESSLLRS